MTITHKTFNNMKNEFEIKLAVENESTVTIEQKRAAKAKAISELKKKGYCAGIVFIYADGTIAITTFPALNMTAFVAHKFQKVQGKWRPYAGAPNWEKYFDFRSMINA
jgi:hypothetical protein